MENFMSTTTYEIEPLGNYVFVKLPPEEEKISTGGIIIPTAAQTKPQLAEIVAVGPGLISLMTGERIPVDAKEGDFVIINKYGCQEVELPDGTMINFLGEGDIISKLIPVITTDDDVSDE